MFVDPAMLTAGATHSHNAADQAQSGAASLDQNTVAEGIFGAFSAADVYHRAISTSHTEHLNTLNGHHRTLSGVADKAHHARRAFVEMDQSNASELHSVRCNSVT